VSPGDGGESVVGAGPMAAADRRLHAPANHGQHTLSSHWEKKKKTPAWHSPSAGPDRRWREYCCICAEACRCEAAGSALLGDLDSSRFWRRSPKPLQWKAKQRARFDHWLPHYREGMLADDQRSEWLASDEDREEALRALRQALVDGRITAEQHSERVSKVLAAQYVAELENLTADIPHGERLPVRADNAALVKAGTQHARAILRSASLRPRGEVAQRLRSWAVWGNAEIDLRDAVIPVDGLDVRVWAYLGDVTIVVPPNVGVSLVATPLPGRVVDDTGSAPAAAPTVRIRALALFGDINVRTAYPSARPSDPDSN
jgi:hypothetical protein